MNRAPVMKSKGVVLAGDKRWVRLPDAHHRHLHPAGFALWLLIEYPPLIHLVPPIDRVDAFRSLGHRMEMKKSDGLAGVAPLRLLHTRLSKDPHLNTLHYCTAVSLRISFAVVSSHPNTWTGNALSFSSCFFLHSAPFRLISLSFLI